MMIIGEGVHLCLLEQGLLKALVIQGVGWKCFNKGSKLRILMFRIKRIHSQN